MPGARSAAAQAGDRPDCARAGIELAPGLSPAWEAAAASACARIVDRPDRDPGARLTLAPDPDGGVRLTVRLTDGRKAERRLARPEELSDVVEALLAVPVEAPPPPPAPDAPSAAPPSATRPPAPAAPPAALPTARSGPETMVDRSIRFDVAGLATVRLLGSPATLGLGGTLSGDVDVSDWIFGARVRVDGALIGFEREAHVEAVGFGAGAFAARRFPVGGVLALDAGLGLDVLAEAPIVRRRQQTDREADDVRGDVRANAFGRVWVSGDGLSFCGLLGFELSPVRLAGEDAARAFGGELGLGIGWAGL